MIETDDQRYAEIESPILDSDVRESPRIYRQLEKLNNLRGHDLAENDNTLPMPSQKLASVPLFPEQMAERKSVRDVWKLFYLIYCLLLDFSQVQTT